MPLDLVAGKYIWPLNNGTTPDLMNTSFGPRINNFKWDFHDGIDLPAPCGTNIYAMHRGIVHRAGCADDSYSSRHVILKVDDPTDGEMYLVHLHLSSIDSAIRECEVVEQGQILGTVGEDNAKYPHLHFEFRKGKSLERNSVHPLSYLPYTNTANFTAPRSDRFNRLNTFMAARLLFSANSKLEGDLQRVEVDLMNDGVLCATRIVDFNNPKTINKGKKGKEDENIYRNGIGVEGYQNSNMVADGRTDLQYGILLHNLPSNCNKLIARVVDIGGNEVISSPIAIPNQEALHQIVDFEDGAMPPLGWTMITNLSGREEAVTNEASTGVCNSRGMRCLIEPTKAVETQHATIEYVLPSGRFEWMAEGCFNPVALELPQNTQIHLLSFLCNSSLSAAAFICNVQGQLRVGITAVEVGAIKTAVNCSTIISIGKWQKWTLHLLRLGTRETTAVLYLDGVEQKRVNWDSTNLEPIKLSAGIGSISGGAKATLLVDELRLTEMTSEILGLMVDR